MTTKQELDSLRSLRWVKSAKKIIDGYEIRTKPGALTTVLTHKIRKNPYGEIDYDQDVPLQQPTEIALPTYYIKIFEDNRYRPFSLRLASKPKKALNIHRLPVTPQYHLDVENWKEYYEPCYGASPSNVSDGRYSFHAATTLKDKAREVAIFLQGADPHYGRHYWRTCFAYRLGLVGDEVLGD